MTPRPYSMSKRAAITEETRRRLVEATVALHAERGILATRPADVAARADVAVTTYYKHFPTLGDLVRACGERLREMLPLPDPSRLEAATADALARTAAMVRTLFDDYEIRERWLHTARSEERAVPELTASMNAMRGLRDGFVRAALGDAAREPRVAGVVTALVDFWAWRTLRREVGLTQDAAIEAVTRTLEQLVGTGTPAARRPRRSGRRRKGASR